MRASILFRLLVAKFHMVYYAFIMTLFKQKVGKYYIIVLKFERGMKALNDWVWLTILAKM